MASIRNLSRRSVMGLLAAGSMIPAIARQARSQSSGLDRGAYEGMTVIDAKCFLREANPIDDQPDGLSDAFVAAARSSGLTMISNTVGGSYDMETLTGSIAETDTRIASRPETFMRVLTAADLATAKKTGRVGVAYDVQGTTELGTDAANVARLKDLGVRILQMTYNLETPTGDGCMVPDDGGLTEFGHEVVAEANRLNLLVDASHAGKRTAYDTVAASKAPPAITHAGCEALTSHPRHVPDETLRLIAEKGGVFGLYLMPYLVPEGQAHKEELLRHIEHAINVCGEDHVGIGSDMSLPPLELTPAFRKYWKEEVYEPRVESGVVAPNEGADIFNYVPEYNPADRYYLIGDDLVKRGHSVSRVEKILGGNFARLYGEVWG